VVALLEREGVEIFEPAREKATMDPKLLDQD
jgi:hypothetical protein